MAGRSGTPGRSVTSRALAILDAFDAGSPAAVPLRDRRALGHAADHRAPAAGRADRVGCRWPAAPDGRYEIGPKLWDLGLLAPVQLELRQVAAPFLMDVHTAIRDTVHLAVRDGLSALYVERISGRESVPVVSPVGSRLPLHATGVGKVLLAAAPPEVERAGAALADPGHPPHRVDPGRLRRELTEVRRRHYARTSEEMSPGAASLAVPVQVERPRGPVVVAALGIVVPPHRRDLPRLVPVLEVAARGIGRELARTRDFH